MEENRLSEMPKNYNRKLFYEIYENVKGLKHKLAMEIDHDRFGLERDDILSWFDIKFIFVFNKYSGSLDGETLKGFIINSFKMYKNRILRVSYQSKYANNPIDIADLYDYRNIITTDVPNENYELFLDLAKTFFENNLSAEAFEVMQIDLYLPPYIFDKMLKNYPDSETINKIPPQLIADYLGFGDSAKAADYIQSLRAEVKGVIGKAKDYFSKRSLN